MKRILVILALCSCNYIQALPPSEDGSLEKLKLTHYKHKQCYPFMEGKGQPFGIFSVDVLPGQDRLTGKGPRSNAHEFPWKNTAGFEGRVEHYYYIPGVIEYRDRTFKPEYHGNVERVIDWKFPVGTVFVEELYDGQNVFEVRLKRKTGPNYWYAARYNPWSDARQLIDRLDHTGIRHTLREPQLRLHTIRDPHPIKAFEEQTVALDHVKIPKQVFDWKFVQSSDWRGDCFAPVVTTNYTGGAFHSSPRSCMTCHEQTGKHTSEVEPFRDWYGRIRGSDGIFSFHIFDESCIIEEYGQDKTVKFNPQLKLKKVQ